MRESIRETSDVWLSTPHQLFNLALKSPRKIEKPGLKEWIAPSIFSKFEIKVSHSRRFWLGDLYKTAISGVARIILGGGSKSSVMSATMVGWGRKIWVSERLKR